MSSFKYYFTDFVEYPLASQSQLPANILPFATLWTYVNSNFVNGFLNCGKLLAISLLNRYNSKDKILDPETDIIQSNLIIPGEINKYETVTYYFKQELLNYFYKGYKSGHTDFSIFNDDIFLLNKIQNENDYHYLFIWLDCDVSDCAIGRFKTSDPESEIILKFHDWADDRSSTIGTYKAKATKMDPTWFQGTRVHKGKYFY